MGIRILKYVLHQSGNLCFCMGCEHKKILVCDCVYFTIRGYFEVQGVKLWVSEVWVIFLKVFKNRVLKI